MFSFRNEHLSNRFPRMDAIIHFIVGFANKAPNSTAALMVHLEI